MAPVAGQTIIQDILAATQGRTMLCISHQLAGLASFDWIAVISAGAIVQQGNHSELVQQPGLYRQLWQLQIERWQLEFEFGVISDSESGPVSPMAAA